MWPFKKRETEPKGALLGALLAFQGWPIISARRSAAEDKLLAILNSSGADEEFGTDRVFVGTRPVPVAYWGGEGLDDETPYDITVEGVAIIPVCGMLVNMEPQYWFRYYGYCSTPMIGRMIDQAATDQRVSKILLYISSPGGHSAGISEVAAKIWQVRTAGEKRILGQGDDICSAAYHLGSQCEELYITKSGFSGCIGTLMTPADWSEMYAQFGIKRLRITSTGAETLKGAGTLGTKITAEQQADWKRLCDEIQGLFNADVIQGRGFTAQEMGALATGQYWTGAVGADKKLVDGVASAADVLAALGSGEDVVCEGGASPPDDTEDDDDTATESNRGNNPQTEETMDEKTQKGLVAAFVSEMKTLFASNKPDPAQTELDKLKADSKKREEDALTSAREAATAAATAAYGPATPELTNALAVIAATESPAVLGELASAYKAKVSATVPAGRQTTTPAATPPAAPGAPEAEATSLKPEDYTEIYAARKKKGA